MAIRKKQTQSDLLSVGYSRAKAEFLKAHPDPLEEWRKLNKQGEVFFKKYLEMNKKAAVIMENMDSLQEARREAFEVLRQKATCFADQMDTINLY